MEIANCAVIAVDLPLLPAWLTVDEYPKVGIHGLAAHGDPCGVARHARNLAGLYPGFARRIACKSKVMPLFA